MQKLISYKKIIILGCAAVVLAAVAAIFIFGKKDEAFRSIMVYELEGSAVIERAGVGDMNAAENLYLESGDRVRVADSSMMRMKLDNDKYVTAEANTIFSVEAEGDDANSKTKICLEQGAVTNEIQNPLSAESQYETATPNSVMAVRGTIYRAELCVGGDGEQNTYLCCFDGTVGASPVLPDGTIGEEVEVPAGSQLTVYADGSVDGPEDIAYENLSVQAVSALSNMMDNGAPIRGITREELDSLGTDAAQDAETEAARREEQDKDPAPVLSVPEPSDPAVEAEAADAVQSGQKKRTVDSVVIQAPQETGAAAQETPQDKAQEALKPQPLPVISTTQPNPANNENNGSDGGDAGSNESSEEDNKSESSKDKHKDDSDNNHYQPPAEVTYTVTFRYQGTVFATQTVVRGKKAVEPRLSPADVGEWDFDFATKIKANTTIEWKEPAEN